MSSNDAAVGFGQGVTGGAAAAAITAITSVAKLKKKLKDLGTGNTATVLELQGDGTAWDFGGKVLDIGAQNLTIRGSSTAFVLNNVTFAVDLDHASNILIQDLIFRGTGDKDDPRDGITVEASNTPRNRGSVAAQSFLRITHCTFDGYYDIAVDTKSVFGKPRLYATIDGCLFFDSNPGLDGPGKSTFINRGALNLSALNNRNANSSFTVTRNVFVDVWRRSPRVAGGNFAHVFNNLLFRWGFTGPASKPNALHALNNTWRGMEVGGGDRDPDNSQALIQANRFIPWVDKQQLDMAINIHPTTTVDLSSTTEDANEFDGPDGKLPPAPVDATGAALARPQPSVPTGATGTTLVAAALYLDLTPPPVTTAATVDWTSLVTSAGSPFTDAPSTAARQEVLDKLATAGR